MLFLVAAKGSEAYLNSSGILFVSPSCIKNRAFYIDFVIYISGDAINGLYSGKFEDSKRPDSDADASWTDVTVLQVVNNVTAFPKTDDANNSDGVTMDSDNVHAGYCRLLAIYPNVWGVGEGGIREYHIPNNHERFESRRSTDEMKEQYASQYGPLIVSLFRDVKFAVSYLVWPQEAEEWTRRDRPYNWPTQTMVQSVVSNGCHLVASPHPNSASPDVEFKICFGAAERTLCEGLSREQRFVHIYICILS